MALGGLGKVTLTEIQMHVCMTLAQRTEGMHIHMQKAMCMHAIQAYG